MNPKLIHRLIDSLMKVPMHGGGDIHAPHSIEHAMDGSHVSPKGGKVKIEISKGDGIEPDADDEPLIHGGDEDSIESAMNAEKSGHPFGKKHRF